MRRFFDKSTALPLQPWFLVLLAAYAVLELSFNHRLLELASGSLADMRAAQLHDMEAWARVVSGLGLALLLMRWLDKAIHSRPLLVLSSCAVGLLLMWHLQKAVVDAIVDRADQTDLVMSFSSHLGTAEALRGRVELRGVQVLEGPAPAPVRPVMGALWTSSVLGLAPDDVDILSGATQLLGHWPMAGPSNAQMRDAYRKAVMTPVALGASLLFGLLNLCQLLAGLSLVVLGRLGLLGLQQRLLSWMLPAWVAACLTWSLTASNVWVDSPGYQLVARPALWQTKPYLAPFLDWSLRAEPAWSDLLVWVHRRLLLDFDFRNPLNTP